MCEVNLMLANPASMALHRRLEFARSAMPCWPVASMCSVWKTAVISQNPVIFRHNAQGPRPCGSGPCERQPAAPLP
ncbi:hypothetical protein HZS93_00264 [Xanthomonas citri]|nr:hypothetical protein HZS93_00264 [Xanthomonas citri]